MDLWIQSGKESGVNGEISITIYTLLCVELTHSLEKTLMLGGIRGGRRRGRQRTRCLDGIIDSIDMSLSKRWDL